MERCFDEGTLQAFLDNELDENRSLLVARHVADCDGCAELLAVVEEETSLMLTALEPEINTLVPTHRLWSKINESIAAENGIGWYATVRSWVANISMPTVASFASLVIVAGTFVFFMSAQPEPASVAIRAREPRIEINTATPRPIEERIVATDDNDTVIRPVRADFSRPQPPRRSVTVDSANSPRLIDGESEYVRTITTLERRVDRKKEAFLSTGARFAYERDLAVVDDAIRRTRREVRANPNNDIAKQVLFNSYQNKIDLLKSVSERGELMASLNR